MKQYTVTGMSSAACSARVEKAVSKVDGVSACSVSLLRNSMGVEGDADSASVIRAVEEAGYGAVLKEADREAGHNAESIREQEKALEALGFDLPDPDKPLSRRNNRKITFDAACRKMLFEIAKRHGLELEEEAEYGNRKYLEKQDFILAKQKEQLAAQQSKLDELTLKVSDMETLLENVSAAAYDKAVEVVTDVVRIETRKEDMRMIEDTKKWVLSPERKAPKATREYAAHRLDTVLDKFLKTMQTTAARLQEKLLKPEVRQKGKEQVKEKARDSVLQLLNRLQAEQAQNKPAAQPRTQEGYSEI